MYRKSWRYYRNSALLWALFFLLLAVAGYALRQPVYWIAVLLLWFIRTPIRNAFAFAHPLRRINWMPETHLEFQEVTFPTCDGLTLFGRFLRSRNRATILLLHELSGTSTNMLIHAEFLAKAGYGIFMFDMRAHGSSDGDTSTSGWREANDVVGAVDYLIHRIDVDGQKIGALGISLGAQAALRGALKTDSIRALVLEGLTPVALSDHGGLPHSLQRWIDYPLHWIYYQVYQSMIGGRDISVLDAIRRIAPRPILLIASGEKDAHFNRLFFQAAGEPKELWEFPNGEHGAAILKDSKAYMQHVTEFFERTLL